MCKPHKPFITEPSNIAPPIPDDADLRSVRWFKLDIVSLLNSDFMQLASPEEFKAAFMLWTKSIHQVPAGSLPNDEAILASWPEDMTIPKALATHPRNGTLRMGTVLRR